MNFDRYLLTLEPQDLKESVVLTSEAVLANIDKYFNYRNNIRGLLLGNVQSGKTAQTLGIISKLADRAFEIFIFLTTDNIYLHAQTLERAKKALSGFDVLSEFDDIRFLSGHLIKPTLIVLKKNTHILRKWRNTLSSAGYCQGRPIVIVDDEADAASLNTLVNKKQSSAINRHLKSIQDLSTSSIYLQVTATPQSVLLQSDVSGWKPLFVNYFEPGAGYIGGDFIYSEPTSYCIRFTEESELDGVRQDSEYIPQGLRDSLMSFLVVCAHKACLGENTCNFLIHPSVRINDHELFANRLGEFLNLLFSTADEESFGGGLQDAWSDLQITKPDLTNFEDIKEKAAFLLEQMKLKIIILNSKSPMTIDYQFGFNIVVGGNSLGRGITLPKLQTVYYCRKSKVPQADTFWQHSRMFGYDRDRGLLRIFTPPSIHKLFTDLNNSNRILINQIKLSGIEGIQLIYPNGIKPTRSNVVDSQFLNLVTGGVNYFPNNPLQSPPQILDKMLEGFDDSSTNAIVNFTFIVELLRLVGSEDKYDWDNAKFFNCVKSLSVKRPSTPCRLIVRRNRDISRGTGTMLSPTDRNLGDQYPHSLILTLYRVNGLVSRGWKGAPFWLPNIKFPEGSSFYDTIKIN